MNCISGTDSDAPDRPAAEPVPLFCEHDNAASFRGFVRKRCELCSLGKLHDVGPVNRFQFDCLPVAKRDRPGLVEKKNIDIPRRFDGPARRS